MDMAACRRKARSRQMARPQKALEFGLDRLALDCCGHAQLPALRAALATHYEKETNNRAVAQNAKAA
jgi:hypothetical protein